MEDYSKKMLRIVVAQVCQAIGWHATQTTAVEYLTDALQKYMHELGVRSCRYSQHYGRTEVNLDDVGLAFRDLNINVSELLEYINNVESVPCAVDVPRYPVHKDSNLNFLKAGSKEVITRPVHIHEHLPPIYPEKEDDVDSQLAGADCTPTHHHGHVDPASVIKDITNTSANGADGNVNFFRKPDIAEIAQTLKKPRLPHEEEGRPTREISSVMMTSGGFISPAREGKLPDAKIPIIPEPAPLRPPTPPRPVSPPVAPPLAVTSTTPTAATAAASLATPGAAAMSTTPLAQPSHVTTPHHQKPEKKVKRQKNANSSASAAAAATTAAKTHASSSSLTSAEAKEKRKRDRHLAKLQKRRATDTPTVSPDKRPPAKRSKTKEFKAKNHSPHGYVPPQRHVSGALTSLMSGTASSHLNPMTMEPLPPVSLPADLTIKSETVPMSMSSFGAGFSPNPSPSSLVSPSVAAAISSGSLEIKPIASDDVKLSSEPDKQKYSIFKKISKKSRDGGDAAQKDKDKPPTPGRTLGLAHARASVAAAGLLAVTPPGLGMGMSPRTPTSGVSSSGLPLTPGASLNLLHHGMYSGFPPLPESTTIRPVPAMRSNSPPHTDPNVIVVDDDDEDSPATRRTGSSPSSIMSLPLTPDVRNASAMPSPFSSPFMRLLASSSMITPPKKQPRKTRNSKKQQQQQQQQQQLHGEQSHPLNLSASPATTSPLTVNVRGEKTSPKKRQTKVGRPSKRTTSAMPPGLMGDLLPNVGGAGFPGSPNLGPMTSSGPPHGLDLAKMDEMSHLQMFKDNPLVSGLPRYPLISPFHLLTGPGLIPNTNFMGSPRNPLLPFPNPFGYGDFMSLRPPIPPKRNEPRSPPPILPPELQSNVYCNVPSLVPDSFKSQLKESNKSAGKLSTASATHTHHPKERSSATPKVLDTPIEISDDEKSNPDKLLTIDFGGAFSDHNNSTPNKGPAPKFHETETSPDKSDDEYERETTVADRDMDHGDKSMSDDASPNVSGSTKADKKRDKEHKKGKRGKDGKIKKKKDKKDKSKSKEKAEKAEKRKEEKKEKDRKKKKEKRKDKMRLMPGFSDHGDQDTAGVPMGPLFSRSKLMVQTGGDNGPAAATFGQNFDQPSPGIASSTAGAGGASHVPKLTLKFGSPRSVASDDPSESKRTSSKSGNGGDEAGALDSSGPTAVGDDRRDSSPELARISPLVTRPPKQKTTDHRHSRSSGHHRHQRHARPEHTPDLSMASRSQSPSQSPTASDHEPEASAGVIAGVPLRPNTASKSERHFEMFSHPLHTVAAAATANDDYRDQLVQAPGAGVSGGGTAVVAGFDDAGVCGDGSGNTAVTVVESSKRDDANVGVQYVPVPPVPTQQQQQVPVVTTGGSNQSAASFITLDTLVNGVQQILRLVQREPAPFTRDKNSDTEQPASATNPTTTATASSATIAGTAVSSSVVVGRGPGRPPKNQNVAAGSIGSGGGGGIGAGISAIDCHHTLSITVDCIDASDGADHAKTTSNTGVSSTTATVASSGGNSASGAGTSAVAGSNNNISLRSSMKSGASNSPGGGGGGGGGGSAASATATASSIGSKKATATESIDADGNQVWICPACGRVDDGTPMIGCDGCDAWYHWVCVGIQVPPDEREDWYCRVCIAKKQEANGADKKKKRKKKNKTNN